MRCAHEHDWQESSTYEFWNRNNKSIDESYVEVRFNEGIKRFSISSLSIFLAPAEASIKDEFAKITAQIQAAEKKKAEELEQNHIRQMVASQMRHTAQKQDLSR